MSSASLVQDNYISDFPERNKQLHHRTIVGVCSWKSGAAFQKDNWRAGVWGDAFQAEERQLDCITTRLVMPLRHNKCAVFDFDLLFILVFVYDLLPIARRRLYDLKSQGANFLLRVQGTLGRNQKKT